MSYIKPRSDLHEHDYITNHPVSNRFPKRHNKTNPNLPDILSETQHDADVANFNTVDSLLYKNPKKLLFAIRKNKYYDNMGQMLENKKEELINQEKEDYRVEVAGAWVGNAGGGLTKATATADPLTKKIRVNNGGYEINMYGIRVPKTKEVDINYIYNTVTGVSEFV